MEVKAKTGSLVILGVALLAYASGRYLAPSKVVTKVVTVTKEVTVKDDNVKTVVQETDEPNGTVEKTTTTVDLSTETTKDATSVVAQQTKTTEKPQWIIGAQLIPQQGTFGPVYGVEAQRRILGPVFAGAFANTDSKVGLAVSVEF
jgi:hypothetical protein